MKIHQNLAALAGVVAALTIPTQARANSINFYLNQGQCTIVPQVLATSFRLSSRTRQLST